MAPLDLSAQKGGGMKISACLVMLIVLVSSNSVFATDQARDEICKALSDDLVLEQGADHFVPQDYRQYSVEHFYSPKLDSCIHVEIKLIGVEVSVRDLTATVITDEPRTSAPTLLTCDIHGVDEVSIEVAREQNGRLYNLPYRDYLTDGQGGLPRALRSPNTPYSRGDCELALERWLVKWK